MVLKIKNIAKIIKEFVITTCLYQGTNNCTILQFSVFLKS